MKNRAQLNTSYLLASHFRTRFLPYSLLNSHGAFPEVTREEPREVTRQQEGQAAPPGGLVVQQQPRRPGRESSTGSHKRWTCTANLGYGREEIQHGNVGIVVD